MQLTPENRLTTSGAMMEAFHDLRVAMDSHTSHLAFGYVERKRTEEALASAEQHIKTARAALERK